jgi:Ca2+-transporting ATPase
MTGSHPNIPHIAVTTDFSSTHSLHSSDDDGKPKLNTGVLTEREQTLSPEAERSPSSFATPLSGGLQPSHARSPSDPAFLSPFSVSPTSVTGGGRMSLDVPPRSPAPSYASSGEGSLTMAPPSPTLSTQSSVHFATSVALRDNKPGDGASSLGLLSTAKHHRRPSWASSAEGHSSQEGTEPDHSGIGLTNLQRVTSAATSMTAESPTNTHVDSLSERSRSRTRGKKDSVDSDGITAISESEGSRRNIGKSRVEDIEEEDPKNTRLELEQDSEDVDPSPFAYKPFTLASMLDPKSLEVLENLGGIQGLLKGLGTSRTRGLRKEALMKSASLDSRPGVVVGASQRHDRKDSVPGIVVTGPDDSKNGDGNEEDEFEGYPVFSATLEQRRQVYGRNVLPHRATKSLLALMWLALKDKVLVGVPFTLTPAVFIAGSTGSPVYRGSSISCSWSFPRFWHSTSGGPTSCRLGRGGSYHGRYFHCCKRHVRRTCESI